MKGLFQFEIIKNVLVRLFSLHLNTYVFIKAKATMSNGFSRIIAFDVHQTVVVIKANSKFIMSKTVKACYPKMNNSSLLYINCVIAEVFSSFSRF